MFSNMKNNMYQFEIEIHLAKVKKSSKSEGGQ